MSDTPTVRTAAAYIRVSTDDQAEYSPDSQIKIIRDYCDKHDLLLSDEFIFIDSGISGRKAKKRPQFNEMIGLAKQKPKPFDVILVWNFSRFARNQEESLVFKNMLKRIGVDVVSVSQSISDDPYGTLMERIIEWQDEFYSINLSHEVKRGMIEKFSRGQPCWSPPFGYEWKGGKGYSKAHRSEGDYNDYVPSSDAVTVQGIFTDYANGMGMVTIARKYGALGMKTRRGNPPDNRLIRYILSNPVYIGKLRASKDDRVNFRDIDEADDSVTLLDGTHEPIINAELWDAAQKRLKQDAAKYSKWARRDQPVQYMLKGLVRCSDCGATLVMTTKSEPGLQCHKYNRGQCKRSHSINMRRAEQIIIDDIRRSALTNDFNIVPPKKISAPLPDAENMQKSLKLAQNKLDRAREAYLAGADTIEEYRANKAILQADIDRIEQLIAAAATQPEQTVDKAQFSAYVTNVVSILESDKFTPEQKNGVLRRIIDRIEFEPNPTTFTIWYKVDPNLPLTDSPL